MPGIMIVPNIEERAALAKKMSALIWRLDPTDEPVFIEIDARIVAGLLHEIERLENQVSDLDALIAAYRKWAAACQIQEPKP